MKGTIRHMDFPITQIFWRKEVRQESVIDQIFNYYEKRTVLIYISIIAFGQQTIRTRRSAKLRLRRNRFVEDLMDLDVRITIRTSTFPMTPTARTRLHMI